MAAWAGFAVERTSSVGQRAEGEVSRGHLERALAGVDIDRLERVAAEAAVALDQARNALVRAFVAVDFYERSAVIPIARALNRRMRMP